MNCIAFLNVRRRVRPQSIGSSEAFGFERSSVHEGPNGTVAHAELQVRRRDDHARQRRSRTVSG